MPAEGRKKYQILIIVLSVLVPISVAFLLFLPEKPETSSSWIHFLPHLNGTINSITSIILISGFIFIRRKKILNHKIAMSSAFFLGVIFLISYVVYHSSSQSTIFGDVNGNGVLEMEEAERTGSLRYVYLSILASHILFAIIVVPFVLFAFYYALTERFERHKKTVRFALPVWLYVSISGVIVYLMVSPYYA